jgi:hypothetical protein
MKKNLLFHVFKFGAIPQSIWSALKVESVLLYDEGCRASVTYHKFRTKGKYFTKKSTVFWGFLIVTEKRLMGYAFKKRIINFDASFRDYKIKVENGNCIMFHFQAEAIIPNSEGIIEIRYFTNKAEQFALTINSHFKLKENH